MAFVVDQTNQGHSHQRQRYHPEGVSDVEPKSESRLPPSFPPTGRETTSLPLIPFVFAVSRPLCRATEISASPASPSNQPHATRTAVLAFCFQVIPTLPLSLLSRTRTLAASVSSRLISSHPFPSIVTRVLGSNLLYFPPLSCLCPLLFHLLSLDTSRVRYTLAPSPPLCHLRNKATTTVHRPQILLISTNLRISLQPSCLPSSACVAVVCASCPCPCPSTEDLKTDRWRSTSPIASPPSAPRCLPSVVNLVATSSSRSGFCWIGTAYPCLGIDPAGTRT